MIIRLNETERLLSRRDPARPCFRFRPTEVYRRRLRSRREAHGLQHEAAGVPLRRAPQLAARRALLVPRHYARGRRVRPGGSGQRHPRAGLRPRKTRRRALRRHRPHLYAPATSRSRKSSSPTTGRRSPSRRAGAGSATWRARSAWRTRARPLPPDAVAGAGAVAAAARRLSKFCRPTRSTRPSFAIRISGCATRPPIRRQRSPRTASRISATPPTMPVGPAATGPSCCGRPIPSASRPSSRISAASAKCTWWKPRWATRTLQAWKYPLPGDEVVTTIQRVIIDLDGPRVVRLQMPPDQHRSTLCDNVACRGGEWADVQWDKEGSQAGLRLDVARSQAGSPADRRRHHRRGARRARREGPDLLRKRQRPRQLALPAGVEGVHLVQRARQLGPSLPLRFGDRQAEEPDHQRRVERHPAAARGREESPALLPGRGPREGARPLFHSLLPHRLRRRESHAAHAGGRQSRSDALHLRQVFRG